MANPEIAKPVKLFAAVLCASSPDHETACQKMIPIWGPVDFRGDNHVFDVTDYYKLEMGENLSRTIIAFHRLVRPEILVEAKLTCNALEDETRTPQGRRVNLDIGYLDHNKLVLASAKEAGQKIYLGKGIWADFVARFSKGAYQPFEWTFFDFRDGRYQTELLKIRSIYLAQLRDLKKEEVW